MKRFLIITIIFIIIIACGIFIYNKLNSIKAEYDIQTVEQFNYFICREEDRYGVIDKNGNVIITATYDSIIIPNPEKDLFVCYKENKTKMLNSKNEEVLTGYDEVSPVKLKSSTSTLCYEKSVLTFKKDNLYGLIDFDGNIIVKNIYESIENLQMTEGKFLVSRDGKYGVLSLKGVLLVNLEYDKISTDGYYSDETKYVKSGYIVANKELDGYKYGYVNYKGNQILDTKYNSLIRITETNVKDIYLIAQEKGKTGLYKNKKEIIDLQYQSIEYEENTNNLIVQKNKLYGVIGLDGKTKIEANKTKIVSKGLYLYTQTSNKNTVYDKDGNEVDINFSRSIYKTENENYNISILENNNIMYYGITDQNNNTLVSEEYKFIEYLYKDYFIAKDESGKLGVINANGKKVLDFKYDLLQALKGMMMLQALIVEENLTEVYNNNMEIVYSKEDATIENKETYIKAISNGETKYFDNNGNNIEENNSIIQNSNLKSQPDNIKEYKKVQYTLNDVYYIKED